MVDNVSKMWDKMELELLLRDYCLCIRKDYLDALNNNSDEKTIIYRRAYLDAVEDIYDLLVHGQIERKNIKLETLREKIRSKLEEIRRELKILLGEESRDE